eukprot:TRINITY_DN67925_c0_g1_i1.p1 TRINITY_DN67925_c0_g1~~TRINITY_DN67925_c0_g1_i1.p1  ORF type:complete len:309 (+),score=117.14 TRINITY_DN67925_c0_g1_i1:47-928(+)
MLARRALLRGSVAAVSRHAGPMPTVGAEALLGARPSASRPTWESVSAQRRWCSADASTVEVDMDHTPNPDCLKFSPSDATSDIDLMPEGVILDVSSESETELSPLAERIFKIEGVEGVCLGDYWLTVTKAEEREWEELSPLVVDAIRLWVASGEKITTDKYVENDDTEVDEDFDTEVVQAIKELVKTRIRPGVQQDGGNIKYIGFEDGVVMLLMQGACQSCPSSTATLKGGIEKMMMHWIPEVIEVRQVDDEFSREYMKEIKDMKRKYRLQDGKLVVRTSTATSDDDLMNRGI